MALDLLADYLVLDNTEVVSYQARVSESVWAAGVPAVALNVTRTSALETAGRLQVAATRGVWHLWAASFAVPTTPRVTDRFVDAGGVTWLIETSGYNPLTGRWELGCFARH